MIVEDVLKSKRGKVITTEPTASIPEVMDVLITNKISCLPVVDADDNLIGIVSDKDIFMAIHRDNENFVSLTVNDLMTTNLVIGLSDDDLNYIAGVMTNNRIRHVPIVEKNKIVGLLSVGDIVKAQMKVMEIENRYLKQYIEGNYPG